MRTRHWGLGLAVAICLTGSTFAEEKAAAKAGGLLCPVSGKPAKLSHKVATPEGPVFFCCDGCPKKFEADPSAFKEKVAAQREVLASYPKVQETCPLSGKPINKEVFVEDEGKKVYFCCKGCQGKYTADPAKYKDKLAATYTYIEPPKCPLSGKPADLSIRLATDSGPVYFCCSGCEKGYKAEPAKYSEKVAEQRKALAAMDRVQVSCPLSGKPVNSKQFVEKDGQKVYFCCENCKGGYEKDPAKYSAKLENSFWYQTRCPVMGEEISPKSFVELGDGRRIYFCCAECEEKLMANPEKYAPKLEAQHVHIDPAKVKAKPST